MRTTNEDNSVQGATTRNEAVNVVVTLSSMEENKDGETETGNETTTTTKKEDDLIAEDGGDECERAPNILKQPANNLTRLKQSRATQTKSLAPPAPAI